MTGVQPQIPISELELPRSIVLRLRRYGISNLDEVVRSLSNHLILNIPGIGLKREQAIQDAVKSYLERMGSVDVQAKASPVTEAETTGPQDQVRILSLDLPKRIKDRLIKHGVLTVGDLKRMLSDNSIYSVPQMGVLKVRLLNNIVDTLQDGNHIVSIEGKSQQSQIGVIDQSPIYRLGLPIRVERSLLRAGIQTVGSLTQALADESIRDVRNLGEKGLQAIAQALGTNTNSPDFHSDLKATRRTVHSTWADAFESFYHEQKKRDMHILLRRFGAKPQRLEQVASSLGVTRERVRQIQKRIGYKYLSYITKNCEVTFIAQLDGIISGLGDDLSIKTLERMLDTKGLLGIFNDVPIDWYDAPIDVSESFVCYLGVAKLDPSRDPIAAEINMQSFREARVASIGNIKAMNAIPHQLSKKVLRKVVFTGGINLNEAARILRVSPEVAKLELERLSLMEIVDGWFSLALLDQHIRKSPLQYAGLKMLSAYECIPIDAFCDGLLRHISRFYSSIAPRQVLVHLLKILGFEISDDRVTTKLPCAGILSKSEQSFVDLVNTISPIVTFIEVAENFYERGLSLPAATRMLKMSPIVEKVEMGLYKIRGVNVTWSDIENAQQRQHIVQKDAEINYGLDGIIRYKVTVSTWGYFSGVISSYHLGDLAGSWKLIIPEVGDGTARLDDDFIWGLSEVFKKLDVSVGTRIELAFNTWNRVLSVRKIDGNGIA